VPSEKYDNLTPMINTGKLNWAGDKIVAILLEGATFDQTQVHLSEVSGTEANRNEIPGRQIDATGSFIGLPVSFDTATAGTTYQVIVAKDDGWGDPWLISFYDEDDSGGALEVTNTGTLTVRPVLIPAADPPTLGIWLQF
jgi:hypothetical protein